jgi:hypothetical protein
MKFRLIPASRPIGRMSTFHARWHGFAAPAWQAVDKKYAVDETGARLGHAAVYPRLSPGTFRAGKSARIR